MRILDIGCNGDKYKSNNSDDIVVGLDVKKFPDVDVVHDLEKTPLPFEDESFDMVYAEHVLEHIDNIIQLIDDVWRILRPNGIFNIIVPHHTNPFAKDIEHRTYWSVKTLRSFELPPSSEARVKSRFKIKEIKIKLISPFGFLEPLVNKFPSFYEWRLSPFMPAVEMRFKLEKTV